MSQNQTRTPHTVKCIDVVTSQGRLSGQLGRVMVETLCGRGFDSRAIASPAEMDRRPDVLLFICDFQVVEAYEKRFRQWSEPPLTAWWFLETLPPGDLSEEFLKAGRKIARCYWPNILTDIFPPLSKYIRTRGPGQKPKCNNFTVLPQKILAYKLMAQLRQKGYNTSNLDYRDIFWTMCRLDNIKRVYSQYPIDIMFSSTLSRCQALTQMGINAHLLPIGYHSMWGENLAYENRDVDVVFLGHIRKKKGKRGLIVRHVEQQMQRHGIKMKVVKDGCFGRERTELLNRTKILLDVVRMPWELPGMRMLIAASCGTLNITCGYAGDDAVYRPGEHFVETSPSKLVDTIQYYLNNESQRHKIAVQARNFLLQKNSFADTVEKVLKVFQNQL